jgi:glucose-6-phosphate-specific signal transduction histidine kinase
MERKHETAALTETEHDIREMLATTHDQTGQTLELLRTLISLVLPDLGGRERPA